MFMPKKVTPTKEKVIKKEKTEKKVVKKPVQQVEKPVKTVAPAVKPKIKKEPPKPPVKKELIYQAVGRRKTAIARVRLIVNKDNKEKTFTVNGRPVEQYFSLAQYKKLYLEPLRTTNTLNRFDISVKIEGSGIPSQLDAMIHGLSRALVHVDPERFKKILRKRDFLTRDPRAKERKKVGLMGARKVKSSPKR